MAGGHWVLLWEADGFWIGKIGEKAGPQRVDVSSDATAEEIVSALGECLAARGYGGQPLLLGVDSRTCMAIGIPHSGRRAARNTRTMAYALEEFLPVAAEDMVCDFVVFDKDALGIAVEASRLQPLLSALERESVPVVSIVPTAMLVLKNVLDKSKRKGRQAIAWRNGDWLELFELVDGRPHDWKTIPTTGEALSRELKALQATAGWQDLDRLTAYNFSADLLDAARAGLPDASVTTDEILVEESALAGASSVLRGKEESWVELCRDQFGRYDPYRWARSQLRILAVAAACLLLALAAAVWIRADKYEQLAVDYKRGQQDTFRRVFPGKRARTGFLMHLESEYGQLAGVTGESGGVPELESAALLLKDVLEPLPEDLRYRLLEIRLEENNVYLDGEVRQHGDAALLAKALRNNGFKVESPHTELIEKGFAMTLTAVRREAKGEDGKTEGEKKPEGNAP